MFGGAYFGRQYFGGQYFSPGKNLVGTQQSGYFGGAFFGKAFFGDAYFPGGHVQSTPTPTPTDDTVLLGGMAYSGREPYSYVTAYQKHKRELETLAAKIAAAEAALESAETEQQAFEEHILREGDNKKAAKKAALEAIKAREEINRLLMMRAELIRRITDEEETLIVLYSLPFIN